MSRYHETKTNIHKDKKTVGRLTAAFLCLFFILCAASCSSIDCVLSNTVHTIYGFYQADGKQYTLTDTLYIITTKHAPESRDTLINRDLNVESINVPISYESPEDVLYFVRTFPYTITRDVTDEEGNTTQVTNTYTAMIADTVRVMKEDFKHFESIDCNPAYFHKIKGVEYTRNGIDSIVINNSQVNYDVTKEHFHIYFKSHD